MKVIVIFTLILIRSIPAVGQNLVGKYEYKITFDGDMSYTEFELELKPDSTFTMSKFVYETCYDYTDILNGKWKVVNKNLSFYNIDQPRYVTKSNDLSIEKNKLLIKEKCDFSHINSNSREVKLLALNSNFKPIVYLNPEQQEYINENLETKFNLPEETFQVVYFNGNITPVDSCFYGGINLVDFDKKNTYEISICVNTNIKSTEFLNPSIQFMIQNDGSLKSLEGFKEMSGEKSYALFKKSQ